ncbi:MAG TPA: DUF11 domain-containing protein [Patescibacteria group bacterium]|nr:DUF11 domain-containing protein [Patescibacteria group bacterium]
MSLLRTVASIALVGIAFAAQANNPVERQRLDRVAIELALKGQEARGTPASVVLDTVNYSDTTVGAATWTRPFSDCSGLSGLGVGVGYHAQEFTVSATGAYDLTSIQDGSADGFLLLYAGAFDPTDQLTNCQAGSDDGVGGIGTSEILGENLTAGTTYILVTTAFEPGEESTFTNTISGGGNVILVGAGPDLGVTVTAPDGVLTGGQFTYELTATNNGVGDATGVFVTDLLSPSVTFVSSDCGATEASGTVTWNIGAFPDGGNATCTITVSMGAQCAVVDNVATIDGAEGDSAGANNTSSLSNSAGNLVLDPSFEVGTPSTDWTEAEATFGTPICDAGGCGVGGGTGPRTGSFWVWFGGLAAGPTTGSMTQSLVIPAGTTNLTFWLETPVCNTANGANDFVRLTIDGNTLWQTDANSATCNTVGYAQVSVDVSAFANDASHTLQFDSATAGNGAVTNFFIDDVELLAPPVCGQFVAPLEPQVPVPAFDRFGIALLAIMLGLLGIAATRRSSI